MRFWVGLAPERGALMRKRKAATAPSCKSARGSKPQSLSDQQFEERRRIAKEIVQALREAGYSSEDFDDDHAQALKRQH
jgi:hypothetical protein